MDATHFISMAAVHNRFYVVKKKKVKQPLLQA